MDFHKWAAITMLVLAVSVFFYILCNGSIPSLSIANVSGRGCVLLTALIILGIIFGSIAIWLFTARVNYRHFVLSNSLRNMDISLPEDGRYPNLTDCPYYMRSWHRTNGRCAECGDTTVDWDATRNQRVAVALFAGPLLGLILGVRAAVLIGQPVPREERDERVARLEAELAEANRALEKATHG